MGSVMGRGILTVYTAPTVEVFRNTRRSQIRVNLGQSGDVAPAGRQICNLVMHVEEGRALDPFRMAGLA